MKAPNLIPRKGLTVSRLFISLIVISIFAGGGKVSARQLSCCFKIGSELTYRHLKAGLPSELVGSLETAAMTKLQVNLAGLIENCQYNIQLSGYLADFTVNLDKLTLCGLDKQSFWELGKKDWVWGKGLAMTPIYPLEEGLAYWGLEKTAVYSPYSLVAGAAWQNLPSGAAWLRLGRMFDSCDWDVSLACLWEDDSYHWEGGTEFSWDLLNGVSLHGAYKREFSQRENKYLLGGIYSGADNIFSFEYYYDKAHCLYLGISNGASMFNKWQWGIKEIIFLEEGNLLSILNLQYLLNDALIPELQVSNYYGKDKSLLGQSPYSWEWSLRLTAYF